MKQLSQNHPKPDHPFHTIFLSKNFNESDIAYYHMIPKNPHDPDSSDIIYLFNSEKKLLGVQVETEPSVIAPKESAITDLSGKVSTYILTLPKSFPDFPKIGELIKILKLNNDPEDSN